MKRTSIALLASCALALAAGCADRPAAGGTGGPAAMNGDPPLDAARVTSAFGWVLTPDRLLTSEDGGATFTSVDVPLPTGAVRAAYFADAEVGVVAGASNDVVTVATTKNGGRTWHARTVHDPDAHAGYSSLTVSFGDDRHGAILARLATSQAFSLGTLFATADGGATWSVRPAPEAGQVGVEPGRTWLAGADLHVTSDQGRTWTRADLELARDHSSPGSTGRSPGRARRASVRPPGHASTRTCPQRQPVSRPGQPAAGRSR